VSPSFLPLAAFGGTWSWLIILFVLLLLFGSRLPSVARSLGQGINSFKKGLSDPVDGGDDDDPAPKKKKSKATLEEGDD
jgi:sec-independent protein translocase protein TatA